MDKRSVKVRDNASLAEWRLRVTVDHVSYELTPGIRLPQLARNSSLETLCEKGCGLKTVDVFKTRGKKAAARWSFSESSVKTETSLLWAIVQTERDCFGNHSRENALRPSC